jgi:hypothetical protein
MFRTAGFVAALLAVQLGLATHAFACKGDKVLFEEDFTAYDPSWGTPDDQFDIKDGKATLKPHAEAAWWHWNPAFAFEDADICVTIVQLDAGDPNMTDAGIMFWVKDNDNFFLLTIAANGKYQISRKIHGEWLYPLSWTQTDALKQGPNEPNTLRLTLKGQSIAIAINDKEVTRLRAQPPERPSSIGLFAESRSDTPIIWQFTSLKVTNVK